MSSNEQEAEYCARQVEAVLSAYDPMIQGSVLLRLWILWTLAHTPLERDDIVGVLIETYKGKKK